MTTELNLNSLTEPVSTSEVRRFRRELESANKHQKPSILSVVAFVAYAVITLLLMSWIAVGVVNSLSDGKPIDWFAIATGILLVLVFTGFAAFLLFAAWKELFGKNEWSKWLRLHRFANDNQLVYGRGAAHPGFPGSLFHAGHSQYIAEHLYRAGSYSLDIGNFVYLTGSGRGQAAHLWGYAAIRLPRRLPHMVLDATANNKRRSTLPAQFARDQMLSLEGDFDQHFTLYCPEEYERDALYILTPDLMALLIDGGGGVDGDGAFDVEVVDDWMFLYSTRKLDLADPATLTRLHAIIDSIGERMRDNTGRYADPRTASEPSRLVDVNGRPLQTRLSNNEIADEGRRLRRVTPVALYVTIGLLVVAGVGSIALLVIFG